MSKNSKGFTLVELLLVLGMMSAVMLVAVPAFGNTLQNVQANSQRSYAQVIANQLNAFNSAALTINDIITGIELSGGVPQFTTHGSSSSHRVINLNDGTIMLQHRSEIIGGERRYSGIGVSAPPSSEPNGVGVGRHFSVNISNRNASTMLSNMINSVGAHIYFDVASARWIVQG